MTLLISRHPRRSSVLRGQASESRCHGSRHLGVALSHWINSCGLCGAPDALVITGTSGLTWKRVWLAHRQPVLEENSHTRQQDEPVRHLYLHSTDSSKIRGQVSKPSLTGTAFGTLKDGYQFYPGKQALKPQSPGELASS